MYQVQFKTSGIVAARFQDRAAAVYWIECNDFGDDKPIADPDTGEVTRYERGDCLGLFTLKKVK